MRARSLTRIVIVVTTSPPVLTSDTTSAGTGVGATTSGTGCSTIKSFSCITGIIGSGVGVGVGALTIVTVLFLFWTCTVVAIPSLSST